MKASVEQIREKYAFTERRASLLLQLPVSSYRYRELQNDEALRERLVALAREKPRFGSMSCIICVRKMGQVSQLCAEIGEQVTGYLWVIESLLGWVRIRLFSKLAHSVREPGKPESI